MLISYSIGLWIGLRIIWATFNFVGVGRTGTLVYSLTLNILVPSLCEKFCWNLCGNIFSTMSYINQTHYSKFRESLFNLMCAICFCIFRLSYHQRIKDMMPESFQSLIPAKPEPKFKYAAEGAGRIKYKISPNLFSKENNLYG